MGDKNYEVATVSVLDCEMELFIFHPEGLGPHPALVLAQHIPVGHTGIENDEFTLVTAARYAEAGYVVAVPFIFHWWPKEEELKVKRDESQDKWMIADVKAAFSYLDSSPMVDSDRIGIVGHCWGGRVAWLGACTIPTLAACAIFYGGRVKIPLGDSDTAPIEMADQINCPVIGFFGSEDQNPTPAQVDDYSDALTRAKVSHVFHRYEGAGHAFQNFPTPDRYHPCLLYTSPSPRDS